MSIDRRNPLRAQGISSLATLTKGVPLEPLVGDSSGIGTIMSGVPKRFWSALHVLAVCGLASPSAASLPQKTVTEATPLLAATRPDGHADETINFGVRVKMAQSQSSAPSDYHVIRMNGELLRIPSAYLDIRPQSVAQPTPASPPNVPKLSFAFWMPDGKPVTHINALSITASQMAMPPPGQSISDAEHIVVVKLLQLNPRKENYVTPFQRFTNATDPKHYKVMFEPDEFELSKFTGGPGSLPYNVTYGTSHDANIQVFLRCSTVSPPGSGAPPTCSGYLYHRSINLEAHLHFRAKGISEWKRIVETLVVLVQGWRQESR